MLKYSEVVDDSLKLICGLLAQIDIGLKKDLLTDDLKDFLLVSKIKLGRMQMQHARYLEEKQK